MVECDRGEVFNETKCQCGETVHIRTYILLKHTHSYVHEYCVCIFCTSLPSISSFFCLLLVDFNSTITVVPRLSQFSILPSLNSVLLSIRKHQKFCNTHFQVHSIVKLSFIPVTLLSINGSNSQGIIVHCCLTNLFTPDQ